MSPKNGGSISWQIMACSAWGILLVLLLWLCHTVNQMQQDMAVVKHVLHIESANEMAKK